MGGLVAITCLLTSNQALGGTPSTELVLDVLQIGTQTYTNVTVTTRSQQYVLFLHAAGMKSYKLSELTAEEREKLGYGTPKEEKPAAHSAQTWAKQTLAKVDAPQWKAVEQKVREALRTGKVGDLDLRAAITPKLMVAFIVTLLVLHLFFSYCCALICVKAGEPPGLLVWLPVLQLIPLLNAARMSPLWFLAWFIPVVNIIASVMWAFKIADARGKSFLVGIMLLLPLLNVLAFLYLAFSNGAKAEKKERKIEIMTLETA